MNPYKIRNPPAPRLLEHCEVRNARVRCRTLGHSPRSALRTEVQPVGPSGMSVLLTLAVAVLPAQRL